MNWTENWFSNMKPLDKPFVYQGIEFNCVENFYQAMKVEKTDVATRSLIAKMNPYVAKKFGRRVKLRSDWDEVKLGVMEYALRKKFAPGTSWYEQLTASGENPIVEFNNWHDTYWGVCGGVGENHLGKLLMKLRSEFKQIDA